MGELILCRQQMAALPYYIETVSLNVYSLEELCYYIEQNLYLIQNDFMDEELCLWLEQEMGMKETADQLREIKETGGILSEFVLCLVSASGYCSPETIKKIRQTLQEMEHRTDFECGKIRADRYMEYRRYPCAVNEYRRILRDALEAPEEGKRENPILIGNVWHNLGTGYAKLFFFEKAAVCYHHAWEWNQNRQSLYACLAAHLCMKDERGFRRRAAGAGLGEEELEQVAKQLGDIRGDQEVRQLEETLEELPNEGDAWRSRAEKLLEEWKEEYRKNCKI